MLFLTCGVPNSIFTHARETSWRNEMNTHMLACRIRSGQPTVMLLSKHVGRALQAFRGLPASTKAAAVTGTYICLVGVALVVAPTTCFSVLFDARWTALPATVPA